MKINYYKITLSFLVIYLLSVFVKADQRYCEIFTNEKFQGIPEISLNGFDIIYNIKLSQFQNVNESEISYKSIKINKDCKLFACSGEKFHGNCIEFSRSEEKTDEIFLSFECKCESKIDKTLLKNDYCAVFYDGWYYSGARHPVIFPGSPGLISIQNTPSNIRSLEVKESCKVALWTDDENGDVNQLSLEQNESFLKENTTNYKWYCCQCDETSDQSCKQAKNISKGVKLTTNDLENVTDFNNFAKYSKKILAIGRNYRWKKSELSKVLKVPEEPIVFMKPTTSFLMEGQPILLPKSLGTIYYEIELGVVIGKKGKFIKVSEALDYVSGYFLALDMTAKEFLKKAINQSRPWEIGKGFDSACPIGHFIPKHLIPDPDNVHLQCKVNGHITQSDSTSQMIFNISSLISYISNYMTLEPYDVILSGTPDGLGPIRHGDVVEGQLGNITTIKFYAKTDENP